MEESTLDFILLLLGAICFIVAFFRNGESAIAGRPIFYRNLIALGLFFWIMVPLIRSLKGL